MRKQEIEFRVIGILERVAKGQPIEDDLVELKAEWPRDHFRAARRIAAHANTARGEPILWLIGVDEKEGAVGADFEELSNWFSRVRSRFDGHLAPSLISLAVPYEDKTVVALFFETDRAPFVIRNPDGTGAITHEVPWREANSTRSALRADLIKLLYPIQKNPRAEVLDGFVVLANALPGQGQQHKFHLALSLKLYLITNASETVVIPFHRCRAAFRPEGQADEAVFENLTISPPTTVHARGFKEKVHSLTVKSTDSEVLIDTAGLVYLEGEIYLDEAPTGRMYKHIRVKVQLTPHHTDLPLVLEEFFDLEPEGAGAGTEPTSRLLGRWLLRKPENGHNHG